MQTIADEDVNLRDHNSEVWIIEAAKLDPTAKNIVGITMCYFTSSFWP